MLREPFVVVGGGVAGQHPVGGFLKGGRAGPEMNLVRGLVQPDQKSPLGGSLACNIGEVGDIKEILGLILSKVSQQ